MPACKTRSKPFKLCSAVLERPTLGLDALLLILHGNTSITEDSTQHMSVCAIGMYISRSGTVRHT